MAQLIPLSHLGIIRLTGPDTDLFLQGQLTCNMNTLTAERWSWGGHCDPKGKLLASFRICRHGDDVLLIMPKDLIAVDLPQMAKYAVFNKVELTDESNNIAVHGLLGETDALPALESGAQQVLDASLLLKDDGATLIIGELPQSLASLEEASIESWKQHEIAQQWPMIDAANSGQLVPQMLNLDAVGGVQYDKGCYIGQETVARMHFRGGNKRATYTLMAESASTLDGELEMAVGENWRKSGTVLNKVMHQDQLWLTAVLPKDLDTDAQFRFGDASLSIQARPYPLFGE